MTIKEMAKKAAEIKELERLKEEAEAEISALVDEIKADMTEKGTDTVIAGAFRISWKLIVSSRLDTTAIKKELPDVAARYMKESSTRRFVIS